MTLKEMREGRGWTQVQLAERVGASRRAVQLWEEGEVTPLLVYRIRIADVFKVTLADITFAKAVA